MAQDHPIELNSEGTFGSAADTYRKIFEHSADAILLMRRVYEDCNQRALHLFGCSREELVGQGPEVFSPACQLDGRSSSEAASLYIQAALGGNPQQFEWTHQRKDGTLIHADVSLTAVPLADGPHLLATLRDATVRRAMQAALLQSEARLRALFECAPDPYYLMDLEGRFIDANRAAELIVGFPRDQLVGKHFLEVGLLPPDQTGIAVAMLENSVAGQPNGPVRLRIVGRGGREVILEIKTHPLSMAGATLVLGVARDITERHNAEKQLQRSESSLRLAQRVGKVGSWETDLVTGALDWSEETFRIFGCDPATFHPTKEAFLALVHPADRSRVLGLSQQARDNQRAYYVEHRIIRPDGLERVVSEQADLLRDGQGRCTRLIGIVQDVTEKTVAERRLAQAHRQLLEASRQAGMAEVAASVLHNVGNVLTSVNVSANLISDSVHRSRAASLGKAVALLDEHAADLGHFMTQDPKGQQFVDFLRNLANYLADEQAVLLQESDSLRANLEHILQIVSVQQAYAKVSGLQETIALTALVEDALKINEPLLQRRGIGVQRQYQAHLPEITVEKHKVLQILVNLVSNAAYACEGSPNQDKVVTVRAYRSERSVQVMVLDNGIGIARDNLTRIFNHGFTTRKDGHGFGLHSGCLSAKEMGGQLLAHSDGPGQGASFTLELPLDGARTPGPSNEPCEMSIEQ